MIELMDQFFLPFKQLLSIYDFYFLTDSLKIIQTYRLLQFQFQQISLCSQSQFFIDQLFKLGNISIVYLIVSFLILSIFVQLNKSKRMFKIYRLNMYNQSLLQLPMPDNFLIICDITNILLFPLNLNNLTWTHEQALI
ncbi:hypothetical protein pb186bvf_019818 [Paramecium bursaria]